MTNTVSRALTAAAIGKPRQYADPFVSTTWAIAELLESLQLAQHSVRGMSAGRIERSEGKMIDAQRALERSLAQASQLSEAIGRVLKAHKGRGKTGESS